MSRIGKLPIPVPKGAKVALDGRCFRAEGPKGKVAQELVGGIDVKIEDGIVTVLRSGDSGAYDQAVPVVPPRLTTPCPPESTPFSSCAPTGAPPTPSAPPPGIPS